MCPSGLPDFSAFSPQKNISQEMLAIARALMTQPRFIIMDEPSEGLAPAILDILVKFFNKLYAESNTRETLIKSARTVSERFFVQSRYRKRRNTLCTREGYAASVSRLMPATAAQYFPFSIPKSGRKRSAHSRRRFIQRFHRFRRNFF